MQLPEKSAGHVAVPVNVRTADDGVVGGPLYMVQQVRFGQAFNTTQHIAPWNPKTDRFDVGTADYYSSVLTSWNFEPKLKMHTNDFQIAAFKPSNWKGRLAANAVVVYMPWYFNVQTARALFVKTVSSWIGIVKLCAIF